MASRFHRGGAPFALSRAVFLFLLCAVTSTHCTTSFPLTDSVHRYRTALPARWMVHADRGVRVCDVASGKWTSITGPVVLVRADAQGVWIDGRRCQGTDVRILPSEGAMLVHGTLPVSSLRIRTEKKQAQVALRLAPQPDPITAVARNWSIKRALPVAISPDAHTRIAQREKRKKQTVPVRVLLSEKKLGAWRVESPTGFVLQGSKARPIRGMKGVTELLISVESGMIRVNGRLFPEGELSIRPRAGRVSLDGCPYDGMFHVALCQGRALLINVLGLEEYVFSVLKTESWPGWPLEINKVLAVASRTYALSMVERAKKTGSIYHLGCTNAHQTYTGAHDCQVRRRAVEETKGLFLSHEGSPILAMFDGCCGGVVPAHIAEFDFSDVPYLARPYACRHCKHLKIYSWKAEFSAIEFAKRVRAHTPTMGKLREAKVAKKDKAGLAQEVLIKDNRQSITLNAQKMYALLSEVKSFCFDLTKKADRVTLKGRGFGHHLGLCQWGAREMVRDGWHHQRILKFYYPGTRLSRVI